MVCKERDIVLAFFFSFSFRCFHLRASRVEVAVLPGLAWPGSRENETGYLMGWSGLVWTSLSGSNWVTGDAWPGKIVERKAMDE